MFEKDNSIDAPADTLGATGLLTSNLYDATVDMAYMEKSAKGAQGVVLHFKLDSGRFYRETIYVTNREGKHIWEKGGRKGYLPGFVLFDEMCTVLTGKDAAALEEPEAKTIKVYDFTARKEMPVEKPVLTSFIGKKLKLGIIELKEDHYQQGSSWAEKNAIEKVFTSEGLTASEINAGITSDGEFADKWLNRYENAVQDKRKNSKGGSKFVYNGGQTSQETGAPATAGESATPSLFGDA